MYGTKLNEYELQYIRRLCIDGCIKNKIVLKIIHDFLDDIVAYQHEIWTANMEIQDLKDTRAQKEKS